MALPPASVLDPASPVNPNDGYSTSGGVSGVQDWHVHTQTVNIMYVRNNQYDGATSSINSAPRITSNWMDINCTVQTQDEIYSVVTFSSTQPQSQASATGNLFKPHVLQLQSDTGVSGGFGHEGVVSTSSMGIIRREVRLDAVGNVMDPIGICTQGVNLVMNQMPGSYNASYDTSSSVNGILAQAMGQLAVRCPSFKATLVEL